jgi:D-hexose-6-phosphate mutarotase
MNHTVDGRISEKTGHGGLSYLELCHKGSVAHVYLHGAHVLHYQPAGEAPVLWHSQKSFFKDGAPIRGGIPICWPWFGPHPSDSCFPMHGPVRLSEWIPVSSSVTEESTSIILQSPVPGEFGASLELTVELGRALSLTLNTKNISDTPLSVTEALHSYFAVSDIAQVSIEGLEGTHYVDKVPADLPTLKQEGAITFASETNRIYFDTTGECIIDDRGLNRRIRVTKTGSRSTVIWNPWAEIAAKNPDFGDDEYVEMVCVETANCGPNALDIMPGEEHALQAQIEVIA